MTTDQTNPYTEIAADIQQLVHRMDGHEWETGSEYELAERLLTTEDKANLKTARVLAELSGEHLDRIRLGMKG